MAQELFTTTLATDPSCQGYWRMENDGWVDYSPNGYTLTPTNSPTFVAGKFGQAGHFVGNSSMYSTITNPPNLRVTGDQTLMAWISADTLPGSTMFVSGVSTSAPANYIQLYLDSSNKANSDVAGGVTGGPATSVAAIGTGVFHHVALVFDSVGSKIHIYLDKVDANVTSTGAHTAGGGFSIGRAGDYNAAYFDGIIDDVAFFNRVLTATEIANYYDGLLASRFGAIGAEI